MKIQSKLLLLIYGVILPPLFCLVLFGFLYGRLSSNPLDPNNQDSQSFGHITRLVNHLLEDNPQCGEDHLFMEDIFCLIEKDGSIRYINPLVMKDPPEYLTGNELLQIVLKHKKDVGLVFSPYQYDNFDGTLIYFSRWFGPLSSRLIQFIPTIILLSIFVLIIPAALGMRFVVQLRYSIQTLEKAIFSVADGTSQINFSKDDFSGDFGQLFYAVQIMSQQLKDEEERRSRFFLAVSHDLKTPLTSIKGYLEALQDGIPETPEEYNDYVGIMVEKAEILEKRIYSLIEYAIFDADTMIMNFQPIEIRDFLKTSMKMFKKEAKSHGVNLITDIQVSSGIMVKGNTKMLIRCFENLLDNSIKYCNKENPKVEIHCYSSTECLHFILRDNGVGIAEGDIKKIFDPFFRCDKNRNRPGFGLGLSSVKSIIEIHNGTILYHNHEEGGAVFEITLPYYDEKNDDKSQGEPLDV